MNMKNWIKRLTKTGLNKYRNVPVQAKLAIWLMICTVFSRGISLITMPLFTRLMDTTQYGKVSAYLTWAQILSILTSFKLTAGVYNKGLSKYKDDREGYCLSMQYATSILTFVWLIVYLIFRKYINEITDISNTLTLLMFVEMFFSFSMGFWSVKEQYVFKYKRIVIATIIQVLLNPLFSILFVLNAPMDSRGSARIMGIVLSQVIVGAFFYLINIRNGKATLKMGYIWFAIKFNLPLIPHYFSEYILNASDKLMIQKLCNYSDVAFYSIAYNAGMLMTIITTSINTAMTPWLFQSLDKKNFKKINKVLLMVATGVLIPIILFIAMAPEAILLLGGEQYAQAVYVVPPVAGSIIFLFLYNCFANVEFYYNKNKFTMYISMIGACLNIILNALLIPIFGYVAAGYTTFVCYFIYCLGHFLYMEHIMKKENGTQLIDKRSLVVLLFVLLIIMIIMTIFYSIFWMRYLIVLIGLAIIIYKRKAMVNMINFIKQ